MLRSSVLVCLSAALAWPTVSPAAERKIDAARSSIKVLVEKSGLFSAFAHDHEILAPIESGTVSESGALSVELAVGAAKLRVLDPKVSTKDRQEIQETMLSSQVLDAARFPQIHFRSSQVEKAASGNWKARGDLTLHGATRPVDVEVSGTSGHYRGAVTLKQTDFGIKPVSIAGGTVKVKDAVRIEFDIFLEP